MDGIHLSIASRLELVRLLGLAVRGICQGLPFSGEDVDALELAVCEAANNSIKHAYKGKPDGTVRVTLAVNDTGLVICVQDRGAPLEDTGKLANDLVAPRSINELPEGGMGLYLIRKAADSVGYKAGDQDNVLVLRKAFPKGSK
ncbi:MAG: ATP-binding protein [Desulfovibrio sp.]|jgi:serine/threonine-protein kinase RsbW